MPRTALSAFVLLALLIPGGLLHADEDPVPGPRPLPKEEDPSEAAPAPEAKPGLKLLAAGAEPRAALRYKIAKGTKDRTEMRMAVESDMMSQVGMAMPPFVAKMNTECTEVTESGDMALTATYTEFGLEASEEEKGGLGMGAMLGAALEQLKGMKVKMVLSPRGEVKSTEMPGFGALGGMGGASGPGQMMDPNQKVVTLPKEPVGVGAKWRVAMKDVDTNGVKASGTVTYTLKAREGSSIVIHAEVRLTAPKQEMGVPDMGGMGVTATLLSMKSTGSIELHADLTRCAPTKLSATLGVAMEMEIGMPGGGGSMPMRQQMDMRLTAKSTPLTK